MGQQREAGIRMSIAAVVVSFNSGSTLHACLTALRAAEGVAEVRVVDNGSSDDSVAIAQRHAVADTRVRFVANADNPGFAAACNQWAAASAAAWLAFVNPDVTVQPNTLAILVRRGEVLGPCVLGVVQVDPEGRPDPAVRRQDPEFARMLRHPWRPHDLSVAADPHQLVQPVPALSGALMVLPRSLFERLGGWDPGYRLHAEDLDLCRRARQAGATVAIANDLKVTHVRGVSSRSRPFFVEWHKHRGLWRYFRRFESARLPVWKRGLVWLAIWGHAASRLPALLAGR